MTAKGKSIKDGKKQQQINSSELRQITGKLNTSL